MRAHGNHAASLFVLRNARPLAVSGVWRGSTVRRHMSSTSSGSSSNNEVPQFSRPSASTSFLRRLSRPLIVGGVGIASFAATYGFLEYQKQKKKKYSSSASPSSSSSSSIDGLLAGPSNEFVERIAAQINSGAQAIRVSPTNENADGDRISEFHTNTFAANSPTEDRHAELLRDPQLYGGSLFGVYDGHGGTAASEFVKQELFDFVKLELGILSLKQQKFISSLPIHTDAAARDRMLALVASNPANQSLYDHLRTYIFNNINDHQLAGPLDALFNPERNVSQSLQLAFLRADSYFLYEALLDHDKLADGFAGACVILSLILNDRIYVANAGDCRAVLGRKRDTSTDPIKGDTRPMWEAVELSRDHGTTNLEERRRLIEAHPNEADIVQDERVKGSLQPTRGIGDGLFKDPNFNDVLPHKLPNWHPPYTTALPEVVSHQITPADQFVVLATDGLFDFFSSQEVVDMVGQYVDQMQQQRDGASLRNSQTSELRLRLQENVSSYLIGKVLNKAGYGKSPEVRMNFCITLPDEAKRGFFDDTTVTVIFLGPHFTNSTNNNYVSSSVQTTSSSSSSSTSMVDESSQQLQQQQQQQQGGGVRLVKPAVMDRVEELIEQKVREDRESGMMWRAWHQSLSGQQQS